MKRCILLIDDDPLILKSFNLLLSHEGYEVIPTSSYDEALKAFEEKQFDLVLSDIRMPGKNTHAPCASAASRELDAPVLAGGV